jgi:hypothetical protein
MVAAKCNISFKINYTSSMPVTGATASYRIKGSADLYTVYPIVPIPISDSSLVTLPDDLASGEYDLMVKLTANGVTAQYISSFKIGKCNPSSCETPDIKSVEVQSNGQIVMDYSVVTANLATPEYQIATDAEFTNIVHLRVGFDYTQLENVYMDDGNIPDNTVLYIRARKHCSSPGGVSDWSKAVQFTSKKWVPSKAPYVFRDAYCVSGKFKNPTDSSEVGASICWTENLLIKTINLTTSLPQVGSYIYLSDGVTSAIPANLAVFDTGGANIGFRENGIKWVRFGSYNASKIYDVDPSTARIIGISTSFNCNS